MHFSCLDAFLTEEPVVQTNNQNFWKTEKELEAAVNGIHVEFREAFSYVVTRTGRERGLPYDYLHNSFLLLRNNNLRDAFPTGRASSKLEWSREYKVIAQANLVIDNAHRVELPEERRNFYVGQALVIRAYTYFHILKHWGDAPLVTRSEDIGEKIRTPWQELAEFALSDLIRAAELLPPAGERRDAGGAAIVSKQVPSRGTALAVMAHLYAWKAALNNEPELNLLAEELATQVIEGGEYVLASSPEAVCTQVMDGNSPEGILELDFINATWEVNQSGSTIAYCIQQWPVHPLTTPATRRTYARMSNEMADAWYPPGDLRREAYLYKFDSMAMVSTSITQGAAYFYKFRKVLVYEDGSRVGRLRAYDNNEILLRLADIILLRAELRVKLGNTSGAISDLNRIRSRAGARLYDASEELAEAIAMERDKELIAEGIGRRYFDIVRNGTFREKLGSGFQTLTDRDVADGALYIPVFEGAFRDNTLMRQTVYWKNNGFQ